MREKNVAKRVALMAMLVALAMIFSYIEVLIPFSVGVPGVKLGLANVVVLIGFYFLAWQEVLIVLIARILLAGFLFGNLSSLVYSLAAGLVSYLVMFLLTRIRFLSVIGVSIAGGVCHNLTQLAVAIILTGSDSLLYYSPVLIGFGAAFGCLVGIVGRQVYLLFPEERQGKPRKRKKGTSKKRKMK